MKQIRYWIEHLTLLSLHGFCKILPWATTSNLFGWIARTIGTHMAMNRKAVRHIRAALQCDETTANTVARDHWNNLGRVMAEFPHLKNIAENHVEFRGEKHLKSLKDDNICGILFGAHIGNWEVIPHALLHHFDLAMHPVYRAPNNPMVDKRLHKYRSPDGRLTPYSKSRKGMVGMVKALKSGEHLGLLIDQKYNEGVDAPFFGMNARTGTAFIELSQKYKCPLVPIRCIREEGKFIIEASAPIETQNRDTMDVLSEAHTILENWIKENPSQWLWVHKRWKAEELRDVT